MGLNFSLSTISRIIYPRNDNRYRVLFHLIWFYLKKIKFLKKKIK